MDPKEKSQKLSTPELESQSLSKKDVAIISPSLNSKVDVGEAMKKQNDVAMFLAEKVISALARNSNFVFSPASISAVLTMVAVTTEEETLRSFIFSILRSSSIDELNAVFHEGANTIFVDGSEDGGPKISGINGVWMDQSLSVSPVGSIKCLWALIKLWMNMRWALDIINPRKCHLNGKWSWENIPHRPRRVRGSNIYMLMCYEVVKQLSGRESSPHMHWRSRPASSASAWAWVLGQEKILFRPS